MPPVGTKRTSGNGPRSARRRATPPAASAGKSLSRSRPRSRAAITSVAVATPGITGTSSSRQRPITLALSPGVTMNSAPASTASSTCSDRTTVPAPTTTSVSVAISLIAARGNRCPEGDLGHRQPTRRQCLPDRHRCLELLEHNDRDDAPAEDGRHRGRPLCHRASHPPSTGRTTP